LSRSVCTSAQYEAPAPPSALAAALHVVSDAPHEVLHRPSEHTWPLGHARPHAPQCIRSVCTLAHWPLHAVCVPGQRSTHSPATQAESAPHARPHAPQCCSSIDSDTQRPSHID
jgi:hypothetical protein